jgi:hypothetical protein
MLIQEARLGMRKSVLFLVAFSLVSLVRSVEAQEPHVAAQSALDQALQQHAASSVADREAVLRLFDRAEVKALAGEVGLDLQGATRAVSMLDAAELAELAAQARQAEQGLVGGQSSITLQTTWIIIGLLLIILLIVALQ